MKAAVIPIGNSHGIRIPKIILEQCHIRKNIELEVKGETITIKPFRKKPRKDWELAFKKMHENKGDRLIIDDSIELDVENWEW